MQSYTNRANGVFMFISMSSIISKMAVRILLKIGRCDIQVSESNLGPFLQTPLFKCSDWKKPKKGSSSSAILFTSKGMHGPLYHIKEA